MRGKWIINLGKRVMEGNIHFKDACRFLLSRIQPKPTDISLLGITFNQADHNLWSVISDIFINQEYTPSGFKINSNDLVVDIGAHKGVFTAYARTKTINSILAFEPHLGNFLELKKLIERHKWQTIKIKNIAISEVVGEIQLFTGTSSSRNSIINRDVVTDEELFYSNSVPSTTLKKAIEDLPKVDFLKMDCEGAEFPILLNCDDDTYPGFKYQVQQANDVPRIPQKVI